MHIRLATISALTILRFIGENFRVYISWAERSHEDINSGGPENHASRDSRRGRRIPRFQRSYREDVPNDYQGTNPVIRSGSKNPAQRHKVQSNNKADTHSDQMGSPEHVCQHDHDDAAYNLENSHNAERLTSFLPKIAPRHARRTDRFSASPRRCYGECHERDGHAQVPHPKRRWQTPKHARAPSEPDEAKSCRDDGRHATTKCRARRCRLVFHRKPLAR